MKLAAWLREQPFTLTMSSGFFGFFAHAGVLSALLEQDLVPARATGSSAGALVTAAWASGVEPDVLKQHLFALQKSDFWDPAPGLGLLKGNKFRSKLEQILVAQSFESCRVPLALSAWDGLARKTRVMDSGPLIDAIYASCAVPFLFQPIWSNRRPLWDGGIKDRPGLAGTHMGERIFYHHIASRSPWRRKGSDALTLPERDNLVSLALHGLPRSGPDKLDLGPCIFKLAFSTTVKALSMDLQNRKVVTSVE